MMDDLRNRIAGLKPELWGTLRDAGESLAAPSPFMGIETLPPFNVLPPTSDPLRFNCYVLGTSNILLRMHLNLGNGALRR